MDSLTDVTALFPQDFAGALKNLSAATQNAIEELRIRRGLPILVKTSTGEKVLSVTASVITFAS